MEISLTQGIFVCHKKAKSIEEWETNENVPSSVPPILSIYIFNFNRLPIDIPIIQLLALVSSTPSSIALVDRFFPSSFMLSQVSWKALEVKFWCSSYAFYFISSFCLHHQFFSFALTLALEGGKKSCWWWKKFSILTCIIIISHS